MELTNELMTLKQLRMLPVAPSALPASVGIMTSKIKGISGKEKISFF